MPLPEDKVQESYLRAKLSFGETEDQQPTQAQVLAFKDKVAEAIIAIVQAEFAADEDVTLSGVDVDVFP